MALLTTATRKKWFKYLGLGEYNKANILKFQKMAFKNSHEWDAIYGKNTDIALRHWHHVKVYTENFEPEEFKCPCGKCTGYPTWMRVNALKHIQTIRTHYGKPMKITSGIRCKYENDRLSGSSKESAHMKGRAVDFFMQGVTDTVPNRNKALKYIKGLKNHKFTYGAYMVDSDGIYRTANSMGNAMHTEVKP